MREAEEQHIRDHENDPGHGAARCVTSGTAPLVHFNELTAVAINLQKNRCWAIGLDRSWPKSPWRGHVRAPATTVPADTDGVDTSATVKSMEVLAL